ncbi:Na+/H+ antiporter NhaC family protein [Sporosarcina highlanderae]|uniref:Na+/H+ antiporter NhaC family protein n=1 Tax=Sporosarcina highlanderae TaxID=3035916 RepID=A0ABT8JX87_9BACL|nr:Na+/H+ antiporter NhaC family protein [Sporosarcina highlanderae]MDN4609181.1 Na+/H+ antiporter NhaC family protein [Sporosarcina highlanderae]
MFQAPTLWGLVPLIIFVVLAFRNRHPVVAISIAIIVGAIMSGDNLVGVGSSIRNGLSSFLGYIGLIIMAGAGLGKIAEKTGAAKNLVRFIMVKIKINTPTKAIIGTMVCSALLSGLLGTLAGANAVLAPVIIPIVAAAGLSPSVVAIIFQGAGTTGLFLGPFTPPMVTLMELTGLSYQQILIFASIPLAVVVWTVTFFYTKKVLAKTLKENAYTAEDLIDIDKGDEGLTEKEIEKKRKISTQATWAFLVTLLGLIVYGVLTEGGSTFAIVIILVTSITTGIAGRLSLNELVETFFEGAKPLVWLFFQFVLFTPFIYYIEKLGGFEALANLLMPLVDSGGNKALLNMITILGVAGIPGSSVAQMTILNEMFLGVVSGVGIPMTVWLMVLLVGSQMTEYLYPVGDTLGAMGIARSKDLKNMIIFGIVATVAALLLVFVFTLIMV